MTWSSSISIIVPTFRRPAGLKLLLDSLQGQAVKGYKLEIIVADNDPQASAREFIDTFAKTSDIDIIYTHIPQPGVSNARNGALEKARGRYLIFIDDDMSVGPNYLTTFMRICEQYDAGLCFLPAYAIMPDTDNPFQAEMIDFFSRTTDAPEGYITQTFGTGGCLVDLQRCSLANPPFDPALNEVGGEDDAMFAHILEQGVKIGWSKAAFAYEHVPAKRATPDYLWTRNFAFGQGPSQEAADEHKTLHIAKWMMVGVIQTLVYGCIYQTLRLIKHPAYLRFMAKTAQGLGKILWWGNYTPKLYGAAALETSST